MTQFRLFITLTVLSMLVAGCGDHNGTGSYSLNPSSQAVSPQADGISVAAATSAQCASGGSVYTVYEDANANGSFDPNENVLSIQTVCNGAVGLSTLISTARVSLGLTGCSSGSGLQINFGLDTNFDTTLEASEITQTQVLCDGATGAAGADGPAGHNGAAAVFKVTAASAAACAAGGATILLASDVGGLGVYSATDPDQQAVTICNGANAPIPAYEPVQAIMPCGNTVAYKEVLLRLADGQVLSSFSDNVAGASTRLAFLTDGAYIDTDDSNCLFSLATSADGQTRSISWLGKVQLTWPITSN